MNTQDFFIKYNNKFLDADGVFGYQCVDVIKQYFKEVLEQPIYPGNAIDYWNNPPIGFQKIQKTLLNHPEPGDLIIWNMGLFGHIGICNWWRWIDLSCFEQNDPLNSSCHFKIYNYSKILGWLRPLMIPTLNIKIARIGINLPPFIDLQTQVSNYSNNKIILTNQDYNLQVDVTAGMLDQFKAYQIIDQTNTRSKFIFIFYPANNTSSFYATYYYPNKNCCITTCPDKDPRLLAFELSHQLQIWYNANRGTLPHIEVVDSNFPDDSLIKSKFNSVLPYTVLFK